MARPAVAASPILRTAPLEALLWSSAAAASVWIQAATVAVASAAMWAARWQQWAGGPHLSLSGGGRRTGRTTDHRLAPLLRVLMPSRTSA